MANASGIASERIFKGEFFHSESGIDFKVYQRGESLWLDYSRRGDPSMRGSQKLDYFLGSGHLGITYLYFKSGYFLESPVAYYGNSGTYDMKPGLQNSHTMPPALPMTRGCMRCHMSGVQRELQGTKNRFAGLPFLHGGITCERCHGDATAHVAQRGKAPIVNPMKLTPERRDSVCISCHLEGDTRIEHKDRDVDDFRPGENIADYISYFVYSGGGISSRGVSEIEELAESKCKKASGHRLSCMSCHDPHYSPPLESRGAFFRKKCLSCHTQQKYSVSHFVRTPDCTSCHMPKGKAERVPHIAWTDHRIRRIQTATVNPDPAKSPTAELVSFLGGDTTSRDLGLGYYDLVLGGKMSQVDKAWQLLRAAQKTDPADFNVLVAMGYLAQAKGLSSQAIEYYRSALKLNPLDPSAENNLAILLASVGQLAAARDLWKATFERNEATDQPGVNLALAECMLGNKDAASQALQRVLAFSPDHPVARRKLTAIQSGQERCIPPSE